MNMNAGVLSKMSVSKMVDSVYRYDQIENYTIFHYGATIGNYESSGYSTESKQFLHYVYPEKGNFDLTYSGVIGASFNLEDSSTTFIPIRYPEILKQKNYGSLSCANFIQHGDLIVYNFPFRSNVYTYNRKTEKQKEYNPQSAYTENEAKPMEKNRSVLRIRESMTSVHCDSESSIISKNTMYIYGYTMTPGKSS